MTVNDELHRVWKDAAVTYFQVPEQFSGGSRENQEESQDSRLPAVNFETLPLVYAYQNIANSMEQSHS
jgi:hypothetical protein